MTLKKKKRKRKLNILDTSYTHKINIHLLIYYYDILTFTRQRNKPQHDELT